MAAPLSDAQLAAITAGREAVRAMFSGGAFPAALGQAIADELADAAMAPLIAELASPRPCACWPAYEHSEHCPIYVASVDTGLED
jgi:hypothetical protein